jgi:transcriptional regulator with XRE-family HTH domain
MDHAGSQSASMRIAFARACRDARIRLRLSQQQVADAVGLSRGYIATIERGRGNPSLAVVDRMSSALGLEAQLTLRAPVVVGAYLQRDLVHARCSGYVERRLRSAGWQTAREVELVQGRSHGWIDMIAFYPGTETLLVIEIKTRLDDLGSVERQLGWYGRSAGDAARRLGWRPRRVVSWLLVLASEEVERVVGHNRDLLSRAFPMRARAMMEWVSNGGGSDVDRGLAMLDPASKRRDWLVRCRIDGRRSAVRYADYADAARRLGS